MIWCLISVRTRKLCWPTAKHRLAAASSSHGARLAGRLRTTPATMAVTPDSASTPQTPTRNPGSA